jgi:nitrite reductase/ring-hydroxylating ferredoxin subunit
MPGQSSCIILCRSDDLADDSSRGFDLDGVRLFAVKKRNRVFIYHNRCPHADLPLNWMPDQFFNVDKSLIQCTSHGALFHIDTGQCVAGPCPGRFLRAVKHQEIKGEICIDSNDLN